MRIRLQSATHASTIALLVAMSLGVASTRGGAQMLETETARLLPRGWWKAGGAFEVQGSPTGRERALPMLVEYGVSDRLEFLVEPVPYTAIRPKAGRRATGAGDLEATLTYGLVGERGRAPAIAIAAEVKVPTARDNLIGTRQVDYAGYVIASKRIGRLDTHINATYTIVGSPPGAHLKNVWGGAAAAVFQATARTRLFGEVLAATAAAPEGENGDSPSATTPIPEAAGAEAVGTLGIGFLPHPLVLLYTGVSHDNTKATQLRVGVTLTYRARR